MTFLILPIWRAPDGTDTGPIAKKARSETHAAELVSEGLATAARARGTNARVLVIDDVEWRTVARVKAR